ncbi:SHOCT domain-containing protein [Streptomyces sp. NPDC046939]|uniref:SHOCT domain-containing protein n=1 Tax=Streptomyces sp. NPDC046939 TaxID=3155376 RepID=UPI0033F8D129
MFHGDDAYRHMSGWDVTAASLSALLIAALILMVAVVALRAVSGPERGSRPTDRPTPEMLLAERFARGEIDEDEYHARMSALHTYDTSAKS